MKKKFLALTMASAVMLMGAGYAQWTDSVSVTSTVKTGSFDMQLTSATLRTGDNEIQNEIQELKNGNQVFHQYDWTHGSVLGFNNNEATIEFRDLYPGGVAQVDLTTVNKGTLPGKISSIEVQYLDGNGALFNSLQAQSSWVADRDGDGVQDPGATGWAHVDDWSEWKSLQPAMNALVSSLNSKNVVIEPNGFLKLGDGSEPGCITFRLDPNAGNEYQNQTVKFKIKFNWVQNDQLANPYNGANGYGGDGDIAGTADIN